MKKLIYIVLGSILFMPGFAHAAGYHVSGNVLIRQNRAMQNTDMWAQMSVRYNTSAPGSPFVYAQGYAGGGVSFWGRDSNNRSFSCYVATSSPIYNAVVDIKNNLSNGSYLYVAKTASSSVCTNVFLSQRSYFLD